MYKILAITLMLAGCSLVHIPDNFVYKNIKTSHFDIASWQKVSNPMLPYTFYIEGDGNSFDAWGYPTNNPTPTGTLVRELAFGDSSANVVYLARPCQYVDDDRCEQKYWTTARFAPEIIEAEFQAIKQIAGQAPVVLVGFSGGAQIAGLLASTKKTLNIKKIVTIAGNLDHRAWTDYHGLPMLHESMNLADYRDVFLSVPQIHYIGEKDEIVPKEIIFNFVGQNRRIKIVKGADHNHNWGKAYNSIWQEK